MSIGRLSEQFRIAGRAATRQSRHDHGAIRVGPAAGRRGFTGRVLVDGRCALSRQR